jgi:hypothetical protein
MGLTNWMAWENGVDLVGSTIPGGTAPNLIIHVARLVHTPKGSAPSGMVMFQPDPQQPPQFMGFISTDAVVGDYFGPHIFADTPFATAPTIVAEIAVDTASAPYTVAANIKIPGYEISVELTELQPIASINRVIGAPLPFSQQGLEAIAPAAKLTINGVAIAFELLPVGISGGAPAVWSPAGVYAR